jgi:hypothetical protein
VAVLWFDALPRKAAWPVNRFGVALDFLRVAGLGISLMKSSKVLTLMLLFGSTGVWAQYRSVENG